MEEVRQNLILAFSLEDKMSGNIKKVKKEIVDLSDKAFESAKYLSGVFNNDQIKRAENYAKVLRSFGTIKLDAKKGLADTFSSKTVEDLGKAFSKLYATQSNAIASFSDDSKNELLDWSEYTGQIADHLEKVFSKDQIRQAKEMAATMRSFNENWERNTFEGMYLASTAENIDQLAQGFANMSASQASAIAKAYREPEQELKDLSDIALILSERLSEIFTKEDINNAAAMAKALRDFNEGWKADTEAGISQLGVVDDVIGLTEAFSKLTTSQVSTIKSLFEEPKKEAEDFSKAARNVAKRISETFTKDEVKKAQEMASSIRKFNEGWQQNTKRGLMEAGFAQNVDQLTEAYAKLSSGQAAAISKLYTETESKSLPLRVKLKEFSDKAHKSLANFKRGTDRIANIIRYRLIRQGLSLLVSQLNEGTKSVYVFARAFRNLDKNNIAESLDKYATLIDNIRGNLGAAWATTLANLSNILNPLLEKVSMAIEKVTAFSSAMAGNATYLAVAEKNAKRYYDTVASGLQDIKVIGSQTQFEEKEVPLETSKFAGKIRDNLSNIGMVTGGVAAGLALLLIGTGHVVAGLEIGAAALGIATVTNQVDMNDTAEKIEKVFTGIGSIVPTIELGLGLLLAANGKFAVGIPLILAGASGMLDTLGDFDLEGDLADKFKIASATITAMSLGLGAILCYFGKYDWGVPLLISGLAGTGMTIAHNWDDIMGAFEALGRRIEIWWWSLWEHDLWGKSWDEKVRAFYEKYPELAPEGYSTESKPLVESYDDYKKLFNEKLGMQLTDEEDQVLRYMTNAVPYANRTYESDKAFTDNVLKKSITDKGYSSDLADLLYKDSLDIDSMLKMSPLERELWLNRDDLLKAIYNNKYADGGFPSAGSIFLAGEVPGQTELLGTINGRTGVAGGAEITGIREAIYEVGAEILAGMVENRTVVKVEGNADNIFNMVREKSADYTQRTGEFAF